MITVTVPITMARGIVRSGSEISPPIYTAAFQPEKAKEIQTSDTAKAPMLAEPASGAALGPSLAPP